MWLLGLLFIIFLSIAGFATIVLILWDLYKEGRDHDMCCGIQEKATATQRLARLTLINDSRQMRNHLPLSSPA